ncbi:MAG: hypothetical protein HY744_15360 [Deltaproteobacteria bacterium]|nr:hypothetical protein [Deltaproteobacteria bacterium]
MNTTSIVKGLTIIGIAAAVACSSKSGGGGGEGGSSSSSSGDAVTCSSVCAKFVAAKCEDECEEGCSQFEGLASLFGCSNGFEAFLECWGGAPDVCKYNDACKSEDDALSACIGKYCVEHPQECACNEHPYECGKYCDAHPQECGLTAAT